MCASVSARASQFDELRARVPAARPWGRVRRHPRSRPRPTPAGHWPSASRLTMTLPATRPPRPPPALQSSSSLLVPPCDGASFKSLPKNNSRKNHENGSTFFSLLTPSPKPRAITTSPEEVFWFQLTAFNQRGCPTHTSVETSRQFCVEGQSTMVSRRERVRRRAALARIAAHRSMRAHTRASGQKLSRRPCARSRSSF